MWKFELLSRHFTLNRDIRDAEVLFELVFKKADLVRSGKVAHQGDLFVLPCNGIELVFDLCAVARSDDPFL